MLRFWRLGSNLCLWFVQHFQWMSGLLFGNFSARIETVLSIVGLWRSWERASMAWKRSSVRSRPGPPAQFDQKPGARLSASRPAGKACPRDDPRSGESKGRFDPDQVHQLSTMPVVYILQSESTQKFYIGSGADGFVRLVEHQRGQTISTRNRGPWVLVYTPTTQ